MLYFSLHRYDNGHFYQGRKEANYKFVGGPGAEGLNVNVAWNNSKMGDAEYLSAFHHLLLPIAYEVGRERGEGGREGGREVREVGREGGREGREGGRGRRLSVCLFVSLPVCVSVCLFSFLSV